MTTNTTNEPTDAQRLDDATAATIGRQLLEALTAGVPFEFRRWSRVDSHPLDGHSAELGTDAILIAEGVTPAELAAHLGPMLELAIRNATADAEDWERYRAEKRAKLHLRRRPEPNTRELTDRLRLDGWTSPDVVADLLSDICREGCAHAWLDVLPDGREIGRTRYDAAYALVRAGICEAQQETVHEAGAGAFIRGGEYARVPEREHGQPWTRPAWTQNRVFLKPYMGTDDVIGLALGESDAERAVASVA